MFVTKSNNELTSNKAFDIATVGLQRRARNVKMKHCFIDNGAGISSTQSARSICFLFMDMFSVRRNVSHTDTNHCVFASHTKPW